MEDLHESGPAWMGFHRSHLQLHRYAEDRRKAGVVVPAHVHPGGQFRRPDHRTPLVRQELRQGRRLRHGAAVPRADLLSDPRLE